MPKWFVHIVGPDDVIEKADELDALRSANAVNVQIEREQSKHANNPNYPFMIAIARKEGDIEIEFDPKRETPDVEGLNQKLLEAIKVNAELVDENRIAQHRIKVAINSCKDVTRLERFAPSVDPVRWTVQLQAWLEGTGDELEPPESRYKAIDGVAVRQDEEESLG